MKVLCPSQPRCYSKQRAGNPELQAPFSLLGALEMAAPDSGDKWRILKRAAELRANAAAADNEEEKKRILREYEQVMKLAEDI